MSDENETRKWEKYNFKKKKIINTDINDDQQLPKGVKIKSLNTVIIYDKKQNYKIIYIYTFIIIKMTILDKDCYNSAKIATTNHEYGESIQWSVSAAAVMHYCLVTLTFRAHCILMWLEFLRYSTIGSIQLDISLQVYMVQLIN